VAVIDSGVHAGHPHVGDVALAAAIAPPDGDTTDRLGHGTAVAAAIRDIAPASRLVVGKIFDRDLSTNADALARGIAWAVDAGAQVVNLSLGTANRSHVELLAASVEHARSARALVVAAGETEDVVWLPGSLDGVVRVVADASLDRAEVRVDASPDGQLTITAAPFPRPIPGVPRERNLSGVSFAVANASGFLARLLEAHPETGGVDDLRRLLLR
jgi:subtilisin family serine protease